MDSVNERGPSSSDFQCLPVLRASNYCRFTVSWLSGQQLFFFGANKNWDTTATQLVGDSNLLVSKWLVAR